jgi:ATP-dependent RNA helicase RhlE
MITFNQLSLAEPLLKALESEGYTHPTPIQAESIPLILEGRDLLGCAQTGTGKTAAFALPILQILSKKAPPVGKRKIRGLILTPTRELALQISESLTVYGKNVDLRNIVIFGGVGQKPQVDGLRAGIDILVATPGRLLDLMQQKHVHLEDVEFFVLDEADRMLDMGFLHDVKRVIAKLPHKRQSLFFSATMPPPIEELAATILTHPARVEVTPVSSTVESIGQSVYLVEKDNKKLLLEEILQNQNIKRVLVFTRTKHGADKVVKTLVKDGIEAQAIHGNKSQGARQRALEGFKKHEIRVLVATDIAARGIDIDDLTHVINYDLPNVPESYVHRIGRTGRAGASGLAISFCDKEERAYLMDIEKLTGKLIPLVQGHPFAPDWGIEISPNAPRPKSKQNPPRGARNARQRPAQKASAGPRATGNSRSAEEQAPRTARGNSAPKRSNRAEGRTQPTQSNSARPAKSARTEGESQGSNVFFNPAAERGMSRGPRRRR